MQTMDKFFSKVSPRKSARKRRPDSEESEAAEPAVAEPSNLAAEDCVLEPSAQPSISGLGGVPGLLQIIEGTEEEEVLAMEAELQETHLQQEAVNAAPGVVPIPTGNAERVRKEAQLSRREHAAAAPGKKRWQILVKSDWETRFPWKDVRVD
jgi:hypothetical protein